MPEDSYMTRLELSLTVLSRILDCNTTNIVNKAFSILISLFFKSFKREKFQTVDGFSLLQASRYLDYMR